MTAQQTDFEAKAGPIRAKYLKPRAERPHIHGARRPPHGADL